MVKTLKTDEAFIETPTNGVEEEKSFKSKDISPDRVDINKLMSKIRENDDKKFKRNMFIIITFLVALAIVGIYVSAWNKLSTEFERG